MGDMSSIVSNFMANPDGSQTADIGDTSAVNEPAYNSGGAVGSDVNAGAQQVGTVAKQGGGTAGIMKGAMQGMQKGSNMSGSQPMPEVKMPGNSYSALFGTNIQTKPIGSLSGSEPAPQPAPQPTLPQMQPVPQPLPVQPVQPQPLPTVPPAPMPMSVSDVRAKFKIQKGDKAKAELDDFLNKVYTNVKSKGRK